VELEVEKGEGGRKELSAAKRGQYCVQYKGLSTTICLSHLVIYRYLLFGYAQLL
jgi:hypothetical protein